MRQPSRRTMSLSEQRRCRNTYEKIYFCINLIVEENLKKNFTVHFILPCYIKEYWDVRSKSNDPKSYRIWKIFPSNWLLSLYPKLNLCSWVFRGKDFVVCNCKLSFSGQLGSSSFFQHYQYLFNPLPQSD